MGGLIAEFTPRLGAQGTWEHLLSVNTSGKGWYLDASEDPSISQGHISSEKNWQRRAPTHAVAMMRRLMDLNQELQRDLIAHRVCKL